jgi:hypothetical protein
MPPCHHRHYYYSLLIDIAFAIMPIRERISMLAIIDSAISFHYAITLIIIDIDYLAVHHFAIIFISHWLFRFLSSLTYFH